MSDGLNPQEAIGSELGGFSAFASIMDALAPETDATEAGQSSEASAAAAAQPGQPAPAGEGAGAAAGVPAAPPAGDGGQPAVPNTGAAADAAAAAAAGTAADGSGDQAGNGHPSRPEWTVDATSIANEFGAVSTGLETTFENSARDVVIGEVRGEYGKYFEAVEQHPRLLVGTQVPRLDGKDGFETIRDSADAAEWQDAAKHLLAAEVKDRVSRRHDEFAPTLQAVHQSIELFQNNSDLIPGTKQFDIDLANRFATMAKDYEMRMDGKLTGYSINPQPLINSIRSQLAAERAATPPAAAPVSSPAAAAAGAPPAAPPQAGIAAKSGSSSEQPEDFSTLFGTLGSAFGGIRI